ncbi:MAG TPA: hypothetical protein VF486_09395 [Actinomycetes bacterium]
MVWPHVGREARVELGRFWGLVEAAAAAVDGECGARAERLTAMLEHWDFEDDEEVRRRLPRTWARLT